MKRPVLCRTLVCFPLFALLLGALNAGADVSFDHEYGFQGAPADGAGPGFNSTLIASNNSILFGVTENGGDNNSGVLFSINTNLTGEHIIHSFDGKNPLNPTASINDGARPCGTPLLVDNVLYGTTFEGGSNEIGTVYSMHTDGSNFQILHHFGALNDGYAPFGSLILAGATLYGLTSQGTNGITFGTLFSIGTDGSNYQVLHTFGPGGDPHGTLLLLGQTLFGMTQDGGSNNVGNIFMINTNGNGFRDLHSFTGATTDGAYPYGSLIMSGSTFYGMTSQGGDSGVGTVFSMNTDGSGFTILHSFALNDAWTPVSDLTLSGSTLYGMAQNGGINSFLGGGYGSGAIFQINMDGSGYRIIHSFEYPTTETDGSVPYGQLFLLGKELYGMTLAGGSTSNAGTIFAINPNALPFITTTTNLPVGNLNGNYSVQLAAGGGTAPYTWTLVSSSLPAGLKLSSAGLISGKPTGLGVVNFTIKVTDHNGSTATQALSLSIVPPDPALAIAITYPAASQQFLNPPYIGIAGTATGSVAVARVQMSLNHGPWLNGFSVNGYTNWNFPLILIKPGTNTLSAFATDANGIISKTNTVTFVDVVDAMLTVRTNGPGSISPVLDGQELLEGATYAMTATAPKGVNFINWTDGSNNVVTNGATIRFVMASNLMLIANLGDTTKPALTITAPKTGAKWSNDTVRVTGTATDNAAVSNVWVSVNGGTWTQASLSGTTWTNQATLTPGTNIISAYAVDTSGNDSVTNSIKVIYILSAQVVVNINGAGTLKPDFNGESLAISNNYTMKATPAKGSGFSFWKLVTDDNTNMIGSPTLVFTMVSNLVITANFADITAPTLKVTAPKSGLKLTGYLINISGTASDNVGVTAVYVQINDDGWVTANGTNSWSLNNQPVTPGANTVQIYATDAAGNASATNRISATAPPDWAPETLAGVTLTVSGPITVSFNATNFSQTDITTNGDSGVGTYFYNKTATNTAELLLTYDAPLSFSNGIPQDILLIFTNLNRGMYTNVDSHDTGTLSAAAALTGVLPSSWTGHTITASHAGSSNKTTVTFTAGNNITISSPSQANRTGTYVVTPQSPICNLLVVTYTDLPDLGNVTYLQLTFSSKTAGHYEVNTYDGTGTQGDSDFGIYTFK